MVMTAIRLEKNNRLNILLEHLLETIHVQLEHAKKMDAEKLKEATNRRQDLLFQLELEIIHAQKQNTW